MFDPVDEPSRLRTFGLLSLRRRWKLIGMCGALSLIFVLLVLAFKPRTYTASTQLLVYVREIHLAPEPVVIPGSADLVQVQNEIEIVQSRGMLFAVARSLGLADDDEFVSTTSGLRNAVERIFGRPKAASITSDVRLDRAVEALKRRLLVKRVGASHTILVSVTTFDPRKSERIANAIGQSALEARVDVDQDSSKSFLRRQRLQGLGPSAYVMTAAGVPEQPDGPRRIVILPGAVGFGIAFGSALALLLDFRNATVRTAAQVEYLGLECIGPVPLWRGESLTSAHEAAAGAESAEGDRFLPNPMLEQTLRRVRVVIDNATVRTIGITSAVAGEGAAAIATHLVRVYRGHKVLLVEAGPSELAMSFSEADFPDLAGESDRPLLSNADVLEKAAGFDFLKTGSLHAIDGDPIWRIYCGSDSQGGYDVIIVSLPPLEFGPAFRMAARHLDGLLLVVEWENTRLETIERAMATSGVSPSDFIGAVLNRVDERMIGEFGDKFWNAEAALAAKRASFACNA